MSNEKVNTRKAGAIKRSFNKWIKEHSDFIILNENWYCGITNDAKRRKLEHQKEKNIAALYFKVLNAGDKETAEYVEKYYHSIGVKNKDGGGQNESSTFVYIFKCNPNMLDNVAYILGIVE